jgi:hypothetical protein
MADGDPLGVITIDSPTSIDHVLTPVGALGLEIGAVFPGDTKPTILRVSISPNDLVKASCTTRSHAAAVRFPVTRSIPSATNAPITLSMLSALSWTVRLRASFCLGPFRSNILHRLMPNFAASKRRLASSSLYCSSISLPMGSQYGRTA